jgi:hypothetical protein
LAVCLLTIALAAPAARSADASGTPAGAGQKVPASEQSKAAPEAAGKSAPTQGKAASQSGGNAASKADAKVAPKSDAKAASKTGNRDTPAKSATAPDAGKKTASKPAPAAGKSPDEIMHQKLEEFGRDAVERMNKHALPSQGKKEVLKNKDGSYTARYVSIDPASLRVSFKKAEPPAGTVSHIGYLHYVEREYFCTAPTAEAAKNGPFEPKISRGQTELIKYMRGKWSY